MIADKLVFINDISNWRNPAGSYYSLDDTRFTKSVYLGDLENNPIKPAVLETNIDITKIKTVYFDKKCTFPRNRISTIDSISRKIKPDKADLIVITVPNFKSYWRVLDIYYSAKTNTYYGTNSDKGSFIAGITTKKLGIIYQNDVVEHCIDKKLMEPDTVFLKTTKITELAQNDVSYINLIQNNPNFKYCTDTEFEKAISPSLSSADDNDIESLEEYFRSTDIEVVQLGMSLLNNYNILDHACSIGLMLVANGDRVSKTKTYKSVSFANILNTLGLNKGDLCPYMHAHTKLGLINKLYKRSLNDDDKLKALKIIHNSMLDLLQIETKRMESMLRDVPFKIDIKIT